MLRQSACERQRTQQTSRGQGTEFPSCDGCPQGAEVAREHGSVEWRGQGPGGRFDRRTLRWRQLLAARRLRQEGLLDEVPTCDAEPAEEAAGA